MAKSAQIWCALLAIALNGIPAYAQEEQSNQSSQSTGAGMAGRGRWQSLSPQQKQALIQRFKQRRASKQGAMTSTTDSSAAPGGSGAPAANDAQLSVKCDIPYGPDPLQRLDVYCPKTVKEPLPVVMFVHGGGWKRGDKGQGDRGTKGATYVANGVIFISINYRLAPSVMHPKQIQDVASAFAWIKEHVKEFGGDPNRIVIMGHSAGAHLVDLLGTNDRFVAEKGFGLKDISGVISLDTASLNLSERQAEAGIENKIVGPSIDQAFGKDPKVLQDASPTLCIHSGKQYPSFLMFCGSSRKTCVAQHKEFADAMNKVGGSVTVRPVALNHGEINRASGQSDSAVFKECLAFIKSK